MKATVKFFNVEKGCGYVSVEGDSRDIFIAHEEPLIVGQEVAVEVWPGPKGPVAILAIEGERF